MLSNSQDKEPSEAPLTSTVGSKPKGKSTDEIDPIRKQSGDFSLHTFGTRWIFEQRAHAFRFRLRLLTFFGIAMPALVGSVVIALGTDFSYLWLIISLASLLGIIQLITSIWSLAAKWDDNFAYANESMTANQQLSDAYKELASNPPSSVIDARTRFELINIERKCRDTQDDRQGITEAEKRAGMRVALRQFLRECAGCNETPKSIESSSCPVCGNFKITRTHRIKEKIDD